MITFTRSWRGYAAGTSVSTLADTIEAIAVAEGAATYGGVSYPPNSYLDADNRTQALVDAGGNVVTPKSAAFSAAVPLTGLQTDMGSYVVTGAIAFTVASGAVTGGSATVDLIADGANAPTFSGMYPTNGSAAYLNFAGAVNSITFYRANGVTWYSITNNASVVSGTYLVPITLLAQQFINVVGGGVYEATAGGTSYTASFTIDRSLASDADGWIQADYTTLFDQVFTLALDNSATNSAAHFEYNNDFYVRISGTGLLSVGANSAIVSTGVTITPSATTKLRLIRRAGAVSVEYSYDGAATWSVAHAWAGVNTDLLFAHFYTVYSATARHILNPKTAGFVPI